MDDDFNTPKALSVVYDFVNECNKTIESNTDGKQFMLRDAMDFLEEVFEIFGVNFVKTSELSKVEEKLLSDRIDARKKKDFQRSDELRDLLQEKGVIVEDTKDGQVWRRA